MSHSSEYLRAGYAGDLTTLRTLHLLAGFASNQEAAHACLVSPETYRRWRTDRRPNPTAIRLLAILGGYVPWRGWENWEVHGGLLFPPGYSRHGIAPGDILALPFLHQLLGEYRRQLRLAECDRLSQAPDRARP
ncbi:MAG: hypothetical protein Kow006_08370 [Gammaproteobacteria bacterium]